MDLKKEILEKTAREYYSSGNEEFNKFRYNSAVVLFFKALVAFTDLYILQKIGQTPSSHTDRFRICQINFPKIYDLLDKDFPFYQDSYNVIMTEELAEVIKGDAEKLAHETQTKL